MIITRVISALALFGVACKSHMSPIIPRDTHIIASQTKHHVSTPRLQKRAPGPPIPGQSGGPERPGAPPPWLVDAPERALEDDPNFDYNSPEAYNWQQFIATFNRQHVHWVRDSDREMWYPQLLEWINRLEQEEPTLARDIPWRPNDGPGLIVAHGEILQIEFYNLIQGTSRGITNAIVSQWVQFFAGRTASPFSAVPGRVYATGELVIRLANFDPRPRPEHIIPNIPLPSDAGRVTPVNDYTNGTLGGPGPGPDANDILARLLDLQPSRIPTFIAAPSPTYKHDELFVSDHTYQPNYTDIGLRLNAEPVDKGTACELDVELRRLDLNLDLVGFSANGVNEQVRIGTYMERLRAIDPEASKNEKATAIARLLALTDFPAPELVQQLEDEIPARRSSKCQRGGKRAIAAHARNFKKRRHAQPRSSRSSDKPSASLRARDEPTGFETDDKHTLSRRQVEDMRVELINTGLTRVDPGWNSVKIRDGYISWSGQATAWKRGKSFRDLGFAGPTRSEVHTYLNHFLLYGNWDYCGRDDCGLSASFPNSNYGQFKQRLCISNRPEHCWD